MEKIEYFFSKAGFISIWRISASGKVRILLDDPWFVSFDPRYHGNDPWLIFDDPRLIRSKTGLLSVKTTYTFCNVAFSKWWIQSYYCSHIVWRSWVHADIRYDFSGPAPLVSPGMFELAGNKRIIKEYTNY